MDARTAGREYEDIDPTMNWAREASSDTLLVYLPGFKREQLKVQITTAGNLRVLGERQVSGNKWNRFRKEMPIASNYNSNKISAKFDDGILHVILPKIIVPAQLPGEAKPAVQPTERPAPAPTAEPQKIAPKQDVKEPPEAEQVPAKPTEDKKPEKSTEDGEKPKDVEEESKRADEAKNGPETALRRKRDDLAKKKATEEDRKRDDTADIGKKMGKTGTKKAGDIGQPQAKNDSENGESLATKLRKPRNLVNAMVVALLIVVLGLYLKHAFRSIGTTEADPEL